MHSRHTARWRGAAQLVAVRTVGCLIFTAVQKLVNLFIPGPMTTSQCLLPPPPKLLSLSFATRTRERASMYMSACLPHSHSHGKRRKSPIRD